MSEPRSVRVPFHALRLWLGIERNSTGHGEKWISGAGALLGILSVYWITHWALPGGVAGGTGGVTMLASMGATAVLLFAVPQGALSQPWAVVGGHLVSATIGVSCQELLPEQSWTGALAVGLAVLAMHYLRCIHPPGGATALAAVIGGAEVHALGYHYLLAPVAINVAAIVLMALAFNALFPWRRYPAHLHRRVRAETSVAPQQRRFELTQEDFVAAMEELNAYADITSERLAELLELAKQHAEQDIVHPQQIVAGHVYSNGRLGHAWSAREVMRIDTARDPDQTMLRYQVRAGDDHGHSGTCTYEAFRLWARFEVTQRASGRWQRVQVQD